MVGGGTSWACLKRTTAGFLQPNAHVFTLGRVLIHHCNEKQHKKIAGLLQWLI